MWFRWGDERGSQIVEFALVAPVLCFLVLSAPVLGITVRTWFVVESAAREGARHAAITGDAAGARQRACSAITDTGRLRETSGANRLFTCDASHVQVEIDQTKAAVTITYHQPALIPGLTALLGGGRLDNTMEIVGRAVYLSEYWR